MSEQYLRERFETSRYKVDIQPYDGVNGKMYEVSIFFVGPGKVMLYLTEEDRRTFEAAFMHGPVIPRFVEESPKHRNEIEG